MHTLRWPLAALMGAVLFLSSAIAVFAASPSISYTGGSTPGATLSVSGSGFQPNEPVSLLFGLSHGSATADGGGNFGGASLTIPNVSSGSYIILAVGQNSGYVAFAYIYVSGFFPQINPSSWYISPGSTLSWSGSGFAPGETVTVSHGGSQIASFNADGGGNFANAGGWPIPYSMRNSTQTFTVQGASSGANFSLAIPVANLYPWANPSTWYATPGTAVSFSGGGFGSNESLSVFLGSTSTTPLATVTADNMGSFMNLGPTPLPFSAQAGGSVANYRIVGNSSGISVAAPVTLASFYASLSPSSYYSAPGGLITLSGTGFSPGESVVISGLPASTSATANGMGAFTINDVQVPAVPNMPATITGTGQSSGATATFTMAIGQYYPDITPSFWFSYPGDTITFSGSGFAPNETLTVSGAGSGTITTTNTGTFSGYTAVLPSSNATYTFTGSKSVTPFSITIALGERFAGIWFDNYWGTGGSSLTVFGAGFGNGESVALSHNGSTFATATAGSDGSFSHLTTMPYAAPGALTITATGATTHATANAQTNVAPIWPNLQFGSYAVAPGQTLQIIGSGYLANEPMQVVIDGNVVGSFSADASGSFNNSSVVLPSLPEGLHDIVMRGTYSFHSSTITIWVLGS